MRKIAIVTDSNSGITQDEGRKLGISVLPMPFYINEVMYLEGVTLSQEEFYERLKKDEPISTSQPNPGEVCGLWDTLLKEYDEIVHIPMSSGLSASCETAMGLARDYDGKVQVVDNQRISVTQKQSVMDALTLVQAGKSAAEIREILEAESRESSIYITLETLKYLKKGGRITPAAAAIGTVLNLKPVLQIQGDKPVSYTHLGTDALKNLNTEIMAGNGPDVLVMDGIPSGTYVEKGMLKDISCILDKIEGEDGILDNIRDSYVQEDGSQYVMPVRFGIPMLQGQGEDVTAITDLTSMADTLEKYQSEYSEMHMPMSLLSGGADAFIRQLADVNAPAWLKEDGTLDEAAVTEYLEQANRIYQTGKAGLDALKAQGFAVHSIGEIKMMSDISASAISVMGGYYKLSAGQLSSPDGLAYLYSAEQKAPNLTHSLWNGQAQNCFIPKQTVVAHLSEG